MNKHEELQETIDELKARIATAEQELAKLAWEEEKFSIEPQEGEVYYTMDTREHFYLAPVELCNTDRTIDRAIISDGRAFPTPASVSAEIRRTRIRRRLEKVARALNSSKSLVATRHGKIYYIYFNTTLYQLQQAELRLTSAPAGTIACEGEDFLEKALKVIPEDDLIWFCENEREEDR